MSEAGGRRQRVLVVDDDQDVVELVSLSLAPLGVDLLVRSTAAEAVEAARTERPDLITLDLFLPDGDGTDVCRAVRAFTDAYVVMLTDRTQEVDRLVGLEVGADDYMVKPVLPKELRARVAALLRRPRSGFLGGTAGLPAASAAPVAPAAPVAVADPAVGSALAGVEVALTPGEEALLSVLAAEPGRPWPRLELAREVFRGDFVESDFLVDVHVAALRRKLRRATPGRDWIGTVDGTSYVFVA